MSEAANINPYEFDSSLDLTGSNDPADPNFNPHFGQWNDDNYSQMIEDSYFNTQGSSDPRSPHYNPNYGQPIDQEESIKQIKDHAKADPEYRSVVGQSVSADEFSNKYRNGAAENATDYLERNKNNRLAGNGVGLYGTEPVHVGGRNEFLERAMDKREGAPIAVNAPEAPPLTLEQKEAFRREFVPILDNAAKMRHSRRVSDQQGAELRKKHRIHGANSTKEDDYWNGAMKDGPKPRPGSMDPMPNDIERSSPRESLADRLAAKLIENPNYVEVLKGHIGMVEGHVRTGEDNIAAAQRDALESAGALSFAELLATKPDVEPVMPVHKRPEEPRFRPIDPAAPTTAEVQAHNAAMANYRHQMDGWRLRMSMTDIRQHLPEWRILTPSNNLGLSPRGKDRLEAYLGRAKGGTMGTYYDDKHKRHDDVLLEPGTNEIPDKSLRAISAAGFDRAMQREVGSAERSRDADQVRVETFREVLQLALDKAAEWNPDQIKTAAKIESEFPLPLDEMLEQGKEELGPMLKQFVETNDYTEAAEQPVQIRLELFKNYIKEIDDSLKKLHPSSDSYQELLKLRGDLRSAYFQVRVPQAQLQIARANINSKLDADGNLVPDFGDDPRAYYISDGGVVLHDGSGAVAYPDGSYRFEFADTPAGDEPPRRDAHDNPWTPPTVNALPPTPDLTPITDLDVFRHERNKMLRLWFENQDSQDLQFRAALYCRELAKRLYAEDDAHPDDDLHEEARQAEYWGQYIASTNRHIQGSDAAPILLALEPDGSVLRTVSSGDLRIDITAYPDGYRVDEVENARTGATSTDEYHADERAFRY